MYYTVTYIQIDWYATLIFCRREASVKTIHECSYLNGSMQILAKYLAAAAVVAFESNENVCFNIFGGNNKCNISLFVSLSIMR